MREEFLQFISLLTLLPQLNHKQNIFYCPNITIMQHENHACKLLIETKVMYKDRRSSVCTFDNTLKPQSDSLSQGLDYEKHLYIRIL